MLTPDIHTCAKLVADNEQLKKKLRHLKKENVALRQQVEAQQEKEKLQTLLKQYVTTRNMEVQTDPPIRSYHKSPWQPPHLAQKKAADCVQDSERVSKLITMHNSLMKRYERELKMNVQHVETITELNLKVNDLEQKLCEAQMNTQKLQQEKVKKGLGSCKSKGKQQKDVSISSDETDLTGVLQELHVVRKERDKLRRESKQLKSELKGLDHGFFEEIEDLKFALQQSAKLNKEYERCLRKMSSQFGVPYPNPERRIVSAR